MRMSRRAVLHGIGGVDYSYTGTYDFYGNASQGFLVLKTSGTLTIKGTVDLCLVGGGGRGANATLSVLSGGGGAGGYVSNHLAQVLSDDFAVTIGAGSTVQGSAGGQTKIGTSYTANGGNSTSGYSGAVGRGTGGDGGGGSSAGTDGEDGIYPWNDSANFSAYRVSGCGGGGYYGSGASAGSGGLGGGGNGGEATNGYPGTANTGGGGGGGGYSSGSKEGGNGGSGVVFICWGYNHN